MFDHLWNRMCSVFRYTPRGWKIVKGDSENGHYVHGTSVLGLSFSPDGSLLALAGGGCLPGVDGTIRLIDVATKVNVLTLHAHTQGVNDISFDPSSGMLASASFDYSVNLWNLTSEDVISLKNQDYKTKSFSKFTRERSLLAIGEDAYLDPPHSVYLYNLDTQENVFEFAIPDKYGVTSLTLSPDSSILAFTASDHHNMAPSRLYIVQLDTFSIELKHEFDGMSFYDLAFVGPDRLIAGVSGGPFDEFETGIVEIELESGTICWSEYLGGIGACIASHPISSEVAVGSESDNIRFYDSTTWELIDEYRFATEIKHATTCSLSYSHDGRLLAYGLSSGRFDIIERGG